MGIRLSIVLALLCVGLYSFHCSWSEESWDSTAVWLRPNVTPQSKWSQAVFEHEHERLQESKVDCNLAYIDFVLKKRNELARSWVPRQTLAEIAWEYNPGLGSHTNSLIVDAILEASARHELDPFLLAALISQESRFKPSVISPGGAVGLGQILPGTAASLGVNPHDPVQNVEGCAKYLATQVKRWSKTDDPVSLALASYNAGPGAVIKYGGVPPYSITRNYVAKITARQGLFQKRAKRDKVEWLQANGPELKDLYGASIAASVRKVPRG